MVFRKLTVRFALPFLGVFLLSALVARSQTVSPLPPPTGYVNDYAGVIDAATKQRMEAILTALKQEADIEFAVATVKTTGDQNIFDYSLAVARGWGIGSKEADQGLLLLHLGMSGSLRFDAALPPPGAHDHFDLVTDRGTLRLNDPRRFGAVVYVDDEAAPWAIKLLGGLGMEPLGDAFDLDAFHAGLRRRKAAVKQARGEVDDTSVGAFIHGLQESKTELAVVLGERTVLDTLASVEPISFVLGRSGRMEKLQVVMITRRTDWEQLTPQLERDQKLAQKPANVARKVIILIGSSLAAKSARSSCRTRSTSSAKRSRRQRSQTANCATAP